MGPGFEINQINRTIKDIFLEKVGKVEQILDDPNELLIFLHVTKVL